MAKDLENKIEGEEVISPAVYFDEVKNSKQKFDREAQLLVIDETLKLMKKTIITKQSKMAKKLKYQCELAIRELDVADQGFNIYVHRKDVEKYMDQVEGKAVKIIELTNYTREIPDDHMDRVTKASELFDELYVVFTDYANKESKKVAKERRKKDPIMFGAFTVKDDDETKPYVEDKMFFICDWIEEKCDLTLEQLVQTAKEKDKKDILYKVEAPSDSEAAKKLLDSFVKEIEKTPVTIEEVTEDIKNYSVLGRIKEKLSGKKKNTKKVSKNDTTEDYKYVCDCGELKLVKYTVRKCPKCGSRAHKIK